MPSFCPICRAELPGPVFEAPDRLHGTPGTYGVTICPTCGAGVTLPPVPDERLHEFYPDDYGPYEERMSRPERLISRLIRAFQSWNSLRTPPLSPVRNRPAGRGLDVGCGRGDLAATLISRGWRMAGLEPSSAACEAARRRGVDVRCGTLATVPLEPDAYDAVVLRHSLEHMNDPVRALSLIASALAPGGLLLVTVPNFGSWQARRFAGRWYHLDVPRHRVHLTPDALQRAIRSAGLDVVSTVTSSTPVGLPASVQYRVFGRCLFPSGMGLRIASGLCVFVLPVSALLDRFGRGGDALHIVAQRPR